MRAGALDGRVILGNMEVDGPGPQRRGQRGERLLSERRPVPVETLGHDAILLRVGQPSV